MCSARIIGMDKYAPNKNYLALYANALAMQFSSALVLTFVGVSLFIQGLSLTYILFYFGLEFIVRALLTPFSGTLVSKLGLNKVVIIANSLLFLYFLNLSLFSINPKLGFASFILHSASKALYHPAKHYLQANFVEDGKRGHYLSLEVVLNGICGALAVSFATFSMIAYKSFFPVALVAGLMLFIASFVLVKVLDDIDTSSSNLNYKKIIKFTLSKKFRYDFAAFAGFAASMGFNNVVISLFIFFIIGSLKLFGIISATLFIVNIILTLIYGAYIDKKRQQSTKIAGLLQILSLLLLATASSPLTAGIFKALYDFSWGSYDGSFTSRFHDKIKRNGLIYACSKEVSLSLSAGMYCTVLAVASLFMTQYFVMILALILVFIGIFIAQKCFTD